MPSKDNPIVAMSFREKLVRGTPVSRVEEQENWVSDDDEEDDGEGCGPAFFQRASPLEWRDSLFVL